MLDRSESLLAIDVGTTALKCALYSGDGKEIASVTEEYDLTKPQLGWVEVDCETYWSALKKSLNDLWSCPNVSSRSVKALAFSAQGETIVPVGKDGRPLRRAIVWLDNRAHAEAEELKSKFEAQHFYEVTGQPEMLATWPAAKILWITRHEPEVAAATSKYLLIEDYLLFRLSGEYVTEGSLATSTGYWNFRGKTWWPAMLHAIGIREDQLPTLVESGTRIGNIRIAIADELGLPKTTAICTGALDQACAAIGAGNVWSGGFSESTGAAVALCVTLSEATLDPSREIPCHYHGIPNTYMLHTFTSGGIVLRWFRDEFCSSPWRDVDGLKALSYDELGLLAGDTAPGADGLVMLPHLQGAMAPENNAAATGVLLGMTLQHTRGHVVRAIMESIAFIVRRNVEVMENIGQPISNVRAVGGGARSPLWKQIEADVLKVPIITMRQPDAAALGAAILAGVAIGRWSNVQEAAEATVIEDVVYEPNKEFAALYDDRYETYRELYSAVLPTYERMSA